MPGDVNKGPRGCLEALVGTALAERLAGWQTTQEDAEDAFVAGVREIAAADAHVATAYAALGEHTTDPLVSLANRTNGATS